MKFRIVTPCSRPQNLPAIYQSILQFKAKTKLDVEWIVIFDGAVPPNLPDLGDTHILGLELHGKCVVGVQQRNLSLELFDDGYLYYVDDDNILHPDFYLIERYLNENILILDQVAKNGRRRVAKHKNVRVGRIDTAQFVIYRPLVKKERFLLVYEADGMFITDLLNSHSENFLYLNSQHGLSYYNYLR